jgi:lipoprotein-releasing system ATP-binding protein
VAGLWFAAQNSPSQFIIAIPYRNSSLQFITPNHRCTYMTLLSATQLHKSFSAGGEQQVRVLHNVSVQIQRGEFVAVTGPSGAGKSTLLHILGSLEVPDSGTVVYELDGHSYNLGRQGAMELARLRNKHIGFVFQFHQLLPEFSAEENVMMPMIIAGASKKIARERAHELLELVGMKHRHEHKPQELSGGEQQRVAIARALINEPDVIFADEPTGNLDSANTASVLSLLRTIRAVRPCTMVIATHSAEVAAAADRVISMKDGEIVIR